MHLRSHRACILSSADMLQLSCLYYDDDDDDDDDDVLASHCTLAVLLLKSVNLKLDPIDLGV